MKSKDKKRKHIKLNIKNIITFFAFITIVLYIAIFYNLYFGKNNVYATDSIPENNEEVNISQAEEVNLDKIIEENLAGKEEYSAQEVELEYITKYNNNPQLPKGTIQVVQEGREGKQEVVIKKTYNENNEVISEEQVSSKITKAAINKIVSVGTGNYKNNYTAKVGDTIYVTSDRLSVMLEPNESSTKVATLNQNNEMKIAGISGDWYKITSNDITGYVKKEATTNLNPNEKYEENTGTTSSGESKGRQELLSTLSFDMKLNKPSGLSLEQFKKVLTDSKDKNNIFSQNAEYFYYIEKQYNINGIFVAAVGIHESNWGTSKIAQEKYNLFGYGAYDSNPYNGAYTFTDYSESIDLLARVFVKYYLNPKGTSIYGGETATGSYYNGATLTGVNTKYATDKNWANAVYTHMKYLYNKL